MSFQPKIVCLALAFAVIATSSASHAENERKKDPSAKDPYAEYVWPPPPDKARIKLEAVILGRADVEGKKSSWKKRLIGASPQQPYDRLAKPMGVAFDPQGRILVTDWQNPALIRFDLEGGRMDVFGTRTSIRLKQPMGLDVAKDGTAYVADTDQKKILAFDSEGELTAWYGETGDLENPTDAAVSPDGKRLFVTDSMSHKIVVFDIASRKLLSSFGEGGDKEGQFAFPTALAFGPEGDLFVVDQLNTRVQLLTPEGEYLDEFGGRGVGYGNFVRPKDIAVDEVGFIYVTDFSFNNFQLFDADFTTLTFIGQGGEGPGRFKGASGIDVQGDRIAVVDQLGGRLQVFKFLVSKTEE